MARPRILAAVSGPSLPVLTDLLGGWCEVIPSLAMRDALERAKRGQIAAVVIGMHFDGSQMPILLEALKSDPATRNIPVVCCRLRPTLLSSATLHAANMLCAALGAEAFLDLLTRRERAGRAAAAAELRIVLRRALGGRPRSIKTVGSCVG